MSRSSTQGTSEALAKLAARCGIASEYQDIWGKRHATSDCVRRAILAAMQFSSEVSPDESLREIEEREWRRLLPPVKVLRTGEVSAISLSLPVASTGIQHRWILTPEKGTAMMGEFLPNELPKLDEQYLGGVYFLRVELGIPLLATPGYYRLEIEQQGRENRAAWGYDPHRRPGKLLPTRSCERRKPSVGANFAALWTTFTT